MKLVDANVLLYATDSSSSQHDACRRWLAAALAGAEPVGFSWLALLAFLRISTNPRVWPRPLTAEQAFDVIERWLVQPAALVVEPTDRHAATLRKLLLPLGTAGNLTSDAHLAALSLEHGAVVVSRDNDFARFEGVRWLDPTRG